MTPEQGRQSSEWMQLAQAGDQIAYASLLAMLTSVTRRFARARVGDVGWIDDVVQETLLTIHGARQTYDPARPFAPWFYAIASSRLIDVLRRERRVRSRELADDSLPEASSAPAPDDGIDVQAIHAALASLPARQRDIIEGLKFRDESVRDIAGRTKMTESAVKVTAHRGYRTLRRLLGGPRRED
ncbi:MAG: sigma-70 family RNA polymerase sigma factor [Acidobacteriota bacterium]